MAVLAAALVASCRALRRQEFRLRAIGYALWAGALGYVVQATLGKEAMTWDFALPYWLLLGLLASAAGWRAPGDAPARVPWRMTGLRGLACGVAILAVAWLWWDWAVGGYRSMVYMRDALGYLGAAERRLLKLQKEGLPPDAGVERGIERGGAFLDLARARSLWPTDVVVGHYVLGALIADVGRCRQSLGHLQWVERAAPGAFNVEYLLGRCHRALGHIAKARVYLTRSIERHPTLTAAYAELAALDAQHAATALLQQVLRERFADPGRAALMGRLMASIELWDAVARLLEDTQRAGESESLRALGAALEDFCREAGRGDRLEALRRRFPAAFAVPPSQGRSLPL